MGKKYIIELLDDCNSKFKGIMLFGLTQEKQISVEMIPEESMTPYTELDMEQVREEAYEDGYKTAKVQCNIQAEKDLREVGERHYQKGLSDAWEAAQKIANMPYDEEEKAFGSGGWSFINKHTASEAIEKIRQYEQKKEEQIQVGDEVNLKCGVGPAIYMQGTNGSDEIYLLFNDGSCGIHGRDEIECKTGRHFHEIAAVLEKMREGQDG